MTKDEWGEPISIYIYTDEQALEDGVLVNIEKASISFRGKLVNRMSSALWTDFEPFLEVGPTLGMSGISYIGRILKTKLSNAVLKGGIWQIPPGLWLLEN